MLNREFKDFTYAENPTSYLGMTLHISKDKSKIHLSQEGLTRQLAEKYLNPAKDFAKHPASENLLYIHVRKLREI